MKRVAIILLLLFTGCASLSQIASLMTCSYDLAGVSNPRVAGIGLSDVSDINKLDAVSALKLTTGLLSGSLPLSATVDVGVTNPNSVAAQLAGLDWQLFFEGVNILEGSTQKQVYVAPNGGRSTVPFDVQVDLGELFKKESKDRLFSFVNGLLNLGESSSQVSLKVRPSISFGGQVYKTGFITVSKNL